MEDSDEDMHHDSERNDEYGSMNSSEASEENRYEKSKRMYPGQKTLLGMSANQMESK